MKEIALKAVTIALPKGADLELQRALQKAEETIRENNALVEQALNNLIKEINNNAE